MTRKEKREMDRLRAMFEARAQRIRDIVAQQWAVAIALHIRLRRRGDDFEHVGLLDTPQDYDRCFIEECGQATRIAALIPCATEVVDGIIAR